MPPENFSKGGYLGPTPKDRDERVTRWRRRVAELLQRLGPAINLVAAEGELTAFYPLYISNLGPDGKPSVHNYTGQGVYFGGTGLREVERGGLLYGNEDTEGVPFNDAMSVLPPGDVGAILVQGEDYTPEWASGGAPDQLFGMNPDGDGVEYKDIYGDYPINVFHDYGEVRFEFGIPFAKGRLMVGRGFQWGYVDTGGASSDGLPLVAKNSDTEGMAWEALGLTGGGTGGTDQLSAQQSLGVEPGVDVQANKVDAENKSGVTLNPGDVVAVHSSGVGWVLADPTAFATRGVGLAITTGINGVSVSVQTEGFVTLSDWTAITGSSTLAARARYYLDSTAGNITTTPPTAAGSILQLIGEAVNSTTLQLRITRPITRR